MSDYPHPFIVFEGLSAVGKSKLAEVTSERISGMYYETPSDAFLEFRELIDKSASRKARFLYYLAGVVDASKEIAEILKQQPVVCDRYILTTLCYHRALGLDVHVPDYVNLIEPDYTFLITCQKEERLRRLHERGLTPNDKAERNGRIEEQFLAAYRAFDPLEIDNTHSSVEETVEKVCSIIT